MRREGEVSLPSGVAQGEEESRFCIAKNGHGLAGVKLRDWVRQMDDARRKCTTAWAPGYYVHAALPCKWALRLLIGGASRSLLACGPMPAAFNLWYRHPCTPLALRCFPPPLCFLLVHVISRYLIL